MSKRFLILVLVAFLSLQAGIIKNEFRVNDADAGGDFNYPGVVLTESDKSMVIWQDPRLGGDHIFGQSFNASGDTVGSNFQFGENIDYENNRYPGVDYRGDSVLVVWTGTYAQWFNIDGYPLDTAFSLNTINVFHPGISIKDTSFIVTWYKFVSGTRHDIFLKEFNFSGDSISSTIKVNDDGLEEDQFYPNIAMDSLGNFVVVWSDERNPDDDVYGQLFDSSLNPVGSNFRINDDTSSAYQSYPSVAMDSAGYFVVTWEDARDNNQNDIYAQIFNPDGDTTGFGGNFKVNDDATIYPQFRPVVDGNGNSEFVIVWSDNRDSNQRDMYAQLFDANGDSVGGNFMVNEFSGPEQEQYPEVSMNNNYFEVTWLGGEQRFSVFKRRFGITGTPVEGEKMVNDKEGAYECQNAAIDMNDDGFCVVAWRSTRYPVGIYMQRFDENGTKYGSNREVLSRNLYRADVAVADNGNFIVAGDLADICYQGFSSSGDSLYPEKVASDDQASQVNYASVGIDSVGNAVIAWRDYRNGNGDIYAQLIDASGDTVGPNFKVNDDTGSANQVSPSVSMHATGEFLVAWRDYRNGVNDIYAQLFDQSGNPINQNFRVDDDTTDSDQYEMDTDILPGGRYVLMWRDYRPGYGIYGTVIDSTGSPLVDNFEAFGALGYYPEVSASSDGRFTVTWWRSYGGSTDIYAQKFNADYSKDSTYFVVNSEPSWDTLDQYSPDIAVSNSSLFFVWESPRWMRGDDIVGKVVDWNFNYIIENESSSMQSTILKINSITFNGKTGLEYSIGEASRVEISIFDITGRKVKTLVNRKMDKGVYSISWNGSTDSGSRVTSGVYFCHLKTDREEDTEKFIMLR